ncbi:hypothetical protein P261_02036 [Lachnospiraceae bacterium TWA4]|nr:hypothetical protein P261_02036 [Lachnospiraceae bacterium TWA4]
MKKNLKGLTIKVVAAVVLSVVLCASQTHIFASAKATDTNKVTKKVVADKEAGVKTTLSTVDENGSMYEINSYKMTDDGLQIYGTDNETETIVKNYETIKSLNVYLVGTDNLGNHYILERSYYDEKDDSKATYEIVDPSIYGDDVNSEYAPYAKELAKDATSLTVFFEEQDIDEDTLAVTGYQKISEDLTIDLTK